LRAEQSECCLANTPSQLEYCVQEASKNGIAAVILAVSTAAAAGTTVIMAPILAGGALAAATTFIAYYGAGEVYNALEKAGYVKV
jgi:hypothetical protein